MIQLSLKDADKIGCLARLSYFIPLLGECRISLQILPIVHSYTNTNTCNRYMTRLTTVSTFVRRLKPIEADDKSYKKNKTQGKQENNSKLWNE